MSQIIPETTQSYRAGVGAFIFNNKKEFLMIQLPSYREDEWDFVKGGMWQGEKEEDTLIREMTEEIGNKFEYKILRRSVWNIIYEWPEELQKQKGFRGQARISYWVKFTSGEINLEKDKVLRYRWVSEDEIADVLKKSNTSQGEVKLFLDDWKLLQQEYPEEFK